MCWSHMLWPACGEEDWGGISKKDAFQQVGTKGGFPREGEKHSQKEGQQVKAAAKRGTGRGRGGRRPILEPGPKWAAWLFIYFRNVGIFSGTSKTWICTKEYLSSHEFFYRVEVGTLNRVVSISHFGKQNLETLSTDKWLWGPMLVEASAISYMGSFLQACPSCPSSQ